MATARRCWGLALRRRYVMENPFQRMDIENTTKPTTPATREQLATFMEKADEMGHPSMALAGLITFELIQRKVDVIGRLVWSHYDSQRIKVIHYKTSKEVPIPLYDEEGCLFPELVDRLDRTKRRGTLIVMRDRKDRTRKEHLPYLEEYFRALFRKIANAAGLLVGFTFLGLRHGGMTEMGDAGLTDQEITSISSRSRQTIPIYTHETMRQRTAGLRKRRAFITQV